MAKALTVKADFSIESIKKEINAEIERYLEEVVRVYSDAGKAMVEDARGRTKDFGAYDGGSFGNITWNLRSSIGCMVFRDGKEVFSYFPVLSTGGEGASTGADYAREIHEGTDSSSIVLVVVAGMFYARAVEDRGYNVITATALGAESILERFINTA